MLISLLPLGWLGWPLGTALIALYLVVALVASAHVLLHKTEVRSAFGWIGIIWLSPLLGGLLYYLFGINRVTRRAMRFERRAHNRDKSEEHGNLPPVAPHLRNLAETGGRITGVGLTAGNALTLYHGGDAAYPVLLEALANARHSIAMSAYIFRPDQVGNAVIDALVTAHHRGVEVRVLVDGVGGGYILTPAWRQLIRAGVPAARFLHTFVPWRMPFLNMRSHKKLLIVDGRLGFCGGLNIGAENCRDYPTKRNRVDDFHARLEGPVVRHLMETFARDWNFVTGDTLAGERWWPPLEAKGAVFARGVSSGPDADLYHAETIFGAALTQAKQRVRIVTPYFLPDDRLLFAIRQAQLSGVDVQILIPQKSDYRFLDWAIRAHLRFFPSVASSIALMPPPFEHAKLMTVDGAFAYFGSSNWDTRSLRLNFEFDLECYDRDFCAVLDAQLDRLAARAILVDRTALSTAPLPARLRDAAVRLFLPYL